MVSVSKYAGGAVDITSQHAGRQWIERLLGGYGLSGPCEYDNSSLDKFEIHFGYGTSRMLRPKKFKHTARKYEIDVWIPSWTSCGYYGAVLTLPSISRDTKTGHWRVADCWKDVAVTWPDDICDAFFALTALPDGEDLAGAYSLENRQDGAYMVSARRLESNRSVISIGIKRRLELPSEAEVTVFHAAESIFRWLIETKQLKRNRGSQEVQVHYYCAELVEKFRDYVYRTAPMTAILNPPVGVRHG